MQSMTAWWQFTREGCWRAAMTHRNRHRGGARVDLSRSAMEGMMAALSQNAVTRIHSFMAARNIATPSDISIPRLTAEDAAQAGVSLAEIKQARRLHNLAGDTDLAAKLDARGLTSAFQIARMPRRQFVASHAEALGLDDGAASVLHDRAQRTANRTMQLFATVGGAVAPPYARAMRSTTVADDAAAYFENLPSYQDLFGNLNYCACEQCKSIFGPAAYFVDLMLIIDEYITKPNKATVPQQFLLQSRRPDLWKIPLTCAATNDLVPALQIVNEVLTRAVVAGLNAPSADALMKQMATTLVYPLGLPFNYPLDRIRE